MLVTVTVVWFFTKAALDETKQFFHEKLYALPDPPTLSRSVFSFSLPQRRGICRRFLVNTLLGQHAGKGFSRLHSAGRVSLDTVQ